MEGIKSVRPGCLLLIIVLTGMYLLLLYSYQLPPKTVIIKANSASVPVFNSISKPTSSPIIDPTQVSKQKWQTTTKSSFIPAVGLSSSQYQTENSYSTLRKKIKNALNITDSKKNECKTAVNIVYRRLNYLQNPANCLTAKKVICDIWKAGMGSTLHHWVYCFIYAYYHKRTLLINLNGWLYLRNVISKDGLNRYEDLFQSISKCPLTPHDMKIAKPWTKQFLSLPSDGLPQVIMLASVGTLDKIHGEIPNIAHFAMPTQLFYMVTHYKVQPMAWWTGILAQYIIRPNPKLQQFIDSFRESLLFESPIVGLHIRRTDKSQENTLFNVDKYMDRIDSFYNNQTKKGFQLQRRVFVTSDEPWQIARLKKYYKNYEFIHPPIYQLAARTKSSRYSAKYLKYFIRDVILLAECDYLVATMTSNVGRLAYELHEVIYSQSRNRHFTSLDSNYHIFGQRPRYRGPYIMQAKQDCPAHGKQGIDVIAGDYLDSCNGPFEKAKTYYCYSKRLRKSGHILAPCLRYLADNEDYPDYSQIDKISLSKSFFDLYAHADVKICSKLSVADNL